MQEKSRTDLASYQLDVLAFISDANASNTFSKNPQNFSVIWVQTFFLSLAFSPLLHHLILWTHRVSIQQCYVQKQIVQ